MDLENIGLTLCKAIMGHMGCIKQGNIDLAFVSVENHITSMGICSFEHITSEFRAIDNNISSK